MPSHTSITGKIQLTHNLHLSSVLVARNAVWHITFHRLDLGLGSEDALTEDGERDAWDCFRGVNVRAFGV